jgi:hypothetical protein
VAWGRSVGSLSERSVGSRDCEECGSAGYLVGARSRLVEARGAGLLLPERPDVLRGLPRRWAAIRRDDANRRQPSEADGRPAAERFPQQVHNNQVFEYNAAGTAETNNTVTLTRQSDLAAYADLVVSNVAAPVSGLSGQAIAVSWNVTNQGDAAAVGPWSEQVYLSADAAVGNDQLLASFFYNSSSYPVPSNLRRVNRRKFSHKLAAVRDR